MTSIEEPRKTLGARIKKLREEKLSLTQREFAALLTNAHGKSPDAVSVSRWERDVVPPSLRYLRQIAAIANVPVSSFFDDEQPRAAA